MPKTKSVKKRQMLKTEIWIREPINRDKKLTKFQMPLGHKGWALISFHKRDFKETSQRKKNKIIVSYILYQIIQCRIQNVKTPETRNAESKNEMTKLKCKVVIVSQKLNLRKNRQMLRIEIWIREPINWDQKLTKF